MVCLDKFVNYYMDLKHVHPLVYLLTAFVSLVVGGVVFGAGEGISSIAEIAGAGISFFGLFCVAMTFITTCMRIIAWDKKRQQK